MSDDNWRARVVLPSIDTNRPTIDPNVNRSWRLPASYNSNSNSLSGFPNSMTHNNYGNAIGMHGTGMHMSPFFGNNSLRNEHDILLSHNRLATDPPDFGNKTNLSGNTEHLNEIGSSTNAEDVSSVSDTTAAYREAHEKRPRDSAHQVELAKARREKAPMSNTPEPQELVWRNQSIRNSNGEGSSKVYNDAYAGPLHGYTNTMSNQEVYGYLHRPVVSNSEIHRPSNKERVEIADIAYKTRMTVVYGERIPAWGESVQTQEQAIMRFLAPFESGQSFAIRIFVKWPQLRVQEWAEILTDNAKGFCRKEEDRQLITTDRVLSLRNFLVRSGLCVEPRIGNAFIAEGCRMLASWDDGNRNYRTAQKEESCFALMLKTVIIAHPGNARESLPVWDLPGGNLITGSAFTDDDGNRLPGGEGIFVDEKGVEHPSGAVLLSRKYCTPAGCITCGVIHPASYFKEAYPKLARAMIDKEISHLKAKLPQIKQKVPAQQNKACPVSLPLTGSLYTPRFPNGAQWNRGRLSHITSSPRPIAPVQIPETYRCNICGKVFDNQRELDTCVNTVHGKSTN